MSTLDDPVLSYLTDQRRMILDRLYALLRCRSVSTNPDYEQGMESARCFWQQRLADAGFSHIKRLSAGGHAAVYAQWLGAADKPTFLVYGHYDVQPPEPLDQWHSPPFEPTLRDERIYARGVSDDKAPSLIALEALSAFLSVEGELPVNIKILLEGEEEVGSATLADICRQHQKLLAADAVISADGARWRTDLATINVGSRGVCGFEFTLTSAVKDLHSGRYGGAVPNALHLISNLIASLHDDNGAIAVQKLLRDCPAPAPEPRAELASIPFDDALFHQQLGTPACGEPHYTTLEKLWLRPTLDVNGLWGGYTGAGGKTVIPHQASAKITLRLVDGQDPLQARQAVIEHLRHHCPAGATLQFREDIGVSEAYTVPPQHPLLLAAETALRDTFDQQPIRVRIGATLPLAQIVLQQLGLDTVMFSFSVADEDFHAPNEFFRLRSFDQGFEAWVRLVRLLAEHSQQRYRSAHC